MKKKILLGVLVLALVAAGLFFYGRYQTAKQVKAAAAAVETAPLKTGSLDVTISAIGKVRSHQSASLTWETSGTVKAVNVDEGQDVKAGDVLAELEQTSLPQTVILAEADLASAQQAKEDLATAAETAKVKAMQDIVTYEQAVKDAQYQLDNYTTPASLEELDAVEAVNQTKATLDEARAAFEPYKFSSSGNTVRENLRETLDNAQADYNSAVRRLQLVYDLEVAQANLQQAHQDYEKWKNGPAEADVKAADSKIAAAEATLKQAWIEAPFDGTITQADPLAGDQVSQGEAAFRIDNLETMYIDLEVSEIDIQKVQTGQEATITFDALLGKTYHGAVEKVAMISTEGSDTVNYLVTVKVEDADRSVHSGMTAEVEIMTEHRENVLLIPNQAIVAEDGRQVVFVMKPGQGRTPVEVTLGIASDSATELVEGDLKEGDPIILNPLGTNEMDLQRMMFGPGGGENRGRNNSANGGGNRPGMQP